MKYILALATVLADATASVTTKRNNLNYADFTFSDYSDAMSEAEHLSPKVTFKTFGESDFENVSDLEQSDGSSSESRIEYE